MKKRLLKEMRALARRATDVAAHSPLKGLDAAHAVMAAAIHLSRRAGMTHGDVADWLRSLAEEHDAAQEAAFGAQVRAAMRKQQRTGTPPESTS